MIVAVDPKREYILFVNKGLVVYDIRLKGETASGIRRRILHLTEKRWCTDRIRREAEAIADEYFSGKVANTEVA